jgi:hypothetical protein
MTKGKHSSAPTGALVRDLAVMAVLFVAAGTLAFGVIWWFQNRADDNQAVGSTGVTTTSSPVSTGPIVTTAPPTTAPVVTETTSPPLRAPSEITVQVLNAVGRAGIAGNLTQALAASGYQTLEPDNYTGAVETSKVWFRQGLEAEAFELARFVPDAEVELNDEIGPEADIVVILGPTYEG